jgi:hypothetical protein
MQSAALKQQSRGKNRGVTMSLEQKSIVEEKSDSSFNKSSQVSLDDIAIPCLSISKRIQQLINIIILLIV